MNTSLRNTTPMTNEQLMVAAPSVFASRPWEGMSNRYMFIPTIQVVDALRKEGFQPVSVQQSNARIEGKAEFTKHMLRFRDFRSGDAPAIRELGTIYPELILTNSHDGGSAYKIDAGLFRLVCLNGMTVSSGNVQQINVRHSGSADAVIEASYKVVEDFPKVIDSVEHFAKLQLAPPQQAAYAASALSLKYTPEETPVAPTALLRPRRSEDADPNLWNTYSVVQEHLMTGGDRATDRSATGRRLKTRGVTGISENQRLNKALWMLTEKMAELLAK